MLTKLRLLKVSLLRKGLLAALLLLSPTFLHAQAYTTTDLTTANWAQVTDVPTLKAKATAGNLFILVDAATASTTPLAMSRLNNSAPIYKPLADPRETPHEVWMISLKGEDSFLLRNMNEKSEYMGNLSADDPETAEYDPDILYFTSNGKGVDVRYAFTVSSNVWSIRSMDLSGVYVGSDATAADNAVIKPNVSSPAGFLIYAIDPVLLFSDATPSTPREVTLFVQNPDFEMGNTTGWRLTMTDGDTGAREYGSTGSTYYMDPKSGDYLFNTYVEWSTNAISQDITGLPEGEYEVSAVLSTWKEKQIFMRVNTQQNHVQEEMVSGDVDGASKGITKTMTVQVGSNHLISFMVRGAVLDWWSSGIGDPNDAGEQDRRHRDFFKVDNVRLICKKYYFTNNAVPLPNDARELSVNQWYYFEAPETGSYDLTGNTSGIYYTTDGTQTLGATGSPLSSTSLSLNHGNRVYFRPTTSGATLQLTLALSAGVKRFTVCSLNVDGMPNKILGIEVNGDGAGNAGSLEIGAYLARKAPDLIAASEDFNFNDKIYDSNLEPAGYWSGTYRGGILHNSSLSGLHFDTDGLNAFGKNATTTMKSETIIPWEQADGSVFDGNDGQFDELIGKGFRYFQIELAEGFMIDVFTTHMDAGSRTGKNPSPETNHLPADLERDSWGEDAIAREAQLRQMADFILTNCDNGRPKIVMGDTNCRYTREDLQTNFFDKLDRGGYTAMDTWVEWCCDGVFPEYLSTTRAGSDRNTSESEIVDKVIYINSKDANANKIHLKYFNIDVDGYVFSDGFIDDFNKDRGGLPMGDHPPVFATFETSTMVYPSVQTSMWFEGEHVFDENNGYVSDKTFEANDGSYLYKGSTASTSNSELYYLMNVGAANDSEGVNKCWLTWGNEPGQLKDAFPYGLVKNAANSTEYTVRNSYGYSLYMTYEDSFTPWANAGVRSDKTPTEFVIKPPYGTYDNTNGVYAYAFYQEHQVINVGQVEMDYNKRRFSINKNNNFAITAERDVDASLWNDWYLISLGQMDEWNRYNLAINNAKSIITAPLPTDISAALSALLVKTATATYSDCKDSNSDADNDGIYNLSKDLEDAYAAALNYLKGQANSNSANKDGEGTWDHEFIPYDLNVAHNGWNRQSGDNLVSIADSKKIANPGFESGSDSWTLSSGTVKIDGGKLVPMGDMLKHTNNFSCQQTISDVPDGYYVLSARVSTGTKPVHQLIDYQKHLVYLQFGENNKYTGVQIESGEKTVEALIYHTGGNFTLGAFSETWFEVDDFTLTRYENYYSSRITDAQYSTLCLPIQVNVPEGLKAYKAVQYGDNLLTLRSVEEVIPAYTPVVIRAVPNVQPEVVVYTVGTEPNVEYIEYAKVRVPGETEPREVLFTELDEFLTNNPGAVVVMQETPQISTPKVFNFFLSDDAVTSDFTDNKLHGYADAALETSDSRYNNNHTDYTYYVLSKQTVSGEQKTGMFPLKTTAYVPRFRAYVKINSSDAIAGKDFFLFDFGEGGNETDGVETTPNSNFRPSMPEGIYTLNGMKISELRPGLNIVRMSDGTVKKIILR